MKPKTKQRATYNRMPGMKYHTKQDHPRKCEACGASTASIHRHGYQAFGDNRFYWKKFMCKSCGKIMKRRTGYSPTSSMPSTMV